MTKAEIRVLRTTIRQLRAKAKALTTMTYNNILKASAARTVEAAVRVLESRATALDKLADDAEQALVVKPAKKYTTSGKLKVKRHAKLRSEMTPAELKKYYGATPPKKKSGPRKLSTGG